ncbi:Gnt-I system high-affinity gluconate transporter [Pedobacter cryoconitis]|uniref:Gnt-I system high-affinity gluconate transporter n=1 Tax=Pedobacter cryoconitis TaxID=188932 RepID=A0A7W8ZLT0_9SPHI|nr:gluconate:H+ symporter [Pedobacter cryoconitis]MBB5636148.1 Gnt-I system high-affinity gluconate transporter [Pedobacter cryoconitis]
MTLIIVLLCILLLIIMVSALRINAFLSFLVVSIVAGIVLGIPLNKIAGSVEKGIGDVLGSLLIIITVGAMLGKLVADSGAAQRIASVIMNICGEKYIQWGVVITGFLIGIPLFYGIGFVLMIPLIFSVVYKYKLPAIYIGLPMLAALSVTHGFLPPHPSPSALVIQFKANMGLTLLYGLIVAIPAIVIGGPLFARTLKNIPSTPLQSFVPVEKPESELPGTFNSFFTALLPVLLLVIAAAFSFFASRMPEMANIMSLAGESNVVMLIALVTATLTLGICQGKKVTYLMDLYGEAIKDVAMILLIIGGSGALKQILVDSGVSGQIAIMLKELHMQPLFLGWLITAVIRFCVGSATVAGLTTAGIILPLMIATNTNPNLMVLAVGAGSLMFSHVNDAGFWMFKEYFNLSLKNTFKSWALMESIVGIVGLIGVLLLNQII